MMKKTSILFTTLAAAIILLTGCGDSTPSNPPPKWEPNPPKVYLPPLPDDDDNEPESISVSSSVSVESPKPRGVYKEVIKQYTGN